MEQELRLRLHNNGKWSNISQAEANLGYVLENGATKLVVELPSEIYGIRHFLELVKPSGVIVSTAELEEKKDDSGIHYISLQVSNDLIDERGRYLIQYVGRKGSQNFTVIKSELKALDAIRSINAGVAICESNPDFITWTIDQISRLKINDEKILQEAKKYTDQRTVGLGHIYGVTGIGDENPELSRTYDAAGINLIKTRVNGNIEVTSSDPAFQEFFNFKESTDTLGNVFVNIPPKSFRIDRIENGEIKAISVKDYESGDEERGFKVHPLFRHYISETEWDGVTARQVAKYLTYYDIVSDEVKSQTGLEYAANEFASWDTAKATIRNTSDSYEMVNWHFISFFRWMAIIYFGTLDIYKFFEKTDKSSYEAELEHEVTEKYGFWPDTTGQTDGISSHTGMCCSNTVVKMFNIDDALHGISCGGIYVNTDGKYEYSNLADFDINNDTGAIKTNVSVLNSTSGDLDTDVITKMGVLDSEGFLQMPTAQRLATAEIPYNHPSVYHTYYCSKTEQGIIPSAEAKRAQIWFMGFTDGPALDLGIYYTSNLASVDDAWYHSNCGCRLCKLPF